MAPPADADAVGATGSLPFFVAFVRFHRRTEDNFVNGVTSSQQCGNTDAGYDLFLKPMV